MSSFLLLYGQEATPEQIATARVVIATADGRCKVLKDNIGLPSSVEGMRVQTFLHVAAASGWEIERP
jgi:hypothetical protein